MAGDRGAAGHRLIYRWASDSAAGDGGSRAPTARAGPGHTPAVAMRVAFIAAECEPWAKTGGLADVVDALARALGQIGASDLALPVDVYLPRYRGIQIPDSAIARTVRVPDPVAAAGVTAVQIIDVAANGYRL